MTSVPTYCGNPFETNFNRLWQLHRETPRTAFACGPWRKPYLAGRTLSRDSLGISQDGLELYVRPTSPHVTALFP